jgi:Xaa-Pro aminopeptidase
MNLPFDEVLLDGLMDGAGIDLVLATTKHNTQYLLGGYRFFFFARMEAIGLSQYIPAVGYPRGKPDRSFYIGHPAEAGQQQDEPIWPTTIYNEALTSEQTAETAARVINKLGLGRGTIGLEMPFLPADAFARLRQLLPHASFINAVEILEDLRAIKQPNELQAIKEASEAIVDSILSTLKRTQPGITTYQIADILRLEETVRGLDFDYCLVATAQAFNRSPSTTRWEKGASMSLDSGGNLRGYIGDLARMACLGPPTALMVELLDEVDSVQMAARNAVKAGAYCNQIRDNAEALMAILPHSDDIEFEAHGVGLVSHEAPHLEKGSTKAMRRLETSMVLSVETTMRNHVVGFVKLEDTLVVTNTGWEAYGDGGRKWNIVEC